MEKFRSEFSITKLEKNLTTKTFIGFTFVLIYTNLIFFQALRAFIPGVYISIFHVVFGEDILVNAMMLLTLVFFFLPIATNTICKKVGLNRVMVFSLYFIAIVRLILSFPLPSKIETICAGILITFYSFFISTFITLWLREQSEISSRNKNTFIVLSIFIAFLIDYFIRSIGLSSDVSLLTPGLIFDWTITQYFWLIFQIPLSILCIYFIKTHFLHFSNDIKPLKVPDKIKHTTLYSLIFAGLGIFLFLQFSLFLYPNVIAQYTITSYFLNNIINIICLMGVICILLFLKQELILKISVSIVLNLFMIISMFLFFFFSKMLTYISSILISISFITIYLNFYILFIRLTEINFKWEKVKIISNGITIGFIFMILFDVMHIFTTDWSGTLELFKDLGPLIMMIGGICFSITTFSAIILIKKEEDIEK